MATITKSQKEELVHMLLRIKVKGQLKACMQSTGYKEITLNAYGRPAHPVSPRAYNKIKAFYNHVNSINDPILITKPEPKVIEPPKSITKESLIDKILNRAETVTIEGDSIVIRLRVE